MKVAALVAWVLTAGGGFLMLTMWLRGGGLRRHTGTASRFPPRLIFGHLSLAVTGLGAWVVYVLSEAAALAWASFGLLLVVAALGVTMLDKWLGGRASEAVESQPEQRFPPLVVALHGLAAVTTVALVMATAIAG